MKTIIKCLGFEEQKALYDAFKFSTRYRVTMLSDSSGDGSYKYAIIIETEE